MFNVIMGDKTATEQEQFSSLSAAKVQKVCEKRGD